MSLTVDGLRSIHTRLLQSAQEDLPRIINSLLPPLLLGLQDAGLRDAIMPILSHCMKVIKQGRIKISPAPVLNLIRKENVPFCCNFAVAFLEVSLSNIDFQSEAPGIVAPLFMALNEFDSFSAVSNSLLHLLLIHGMQLLSVTSPDLMTDKVMEIIADFCLDIALVERGFSENSTGSIFPGQSLVRSNRLTFKKKEWDTMFLKQCKMNLLTVCCDRDRTVFPSYYLVPFLIFASLDADIDVRTLAKEKLDSVEYLVGSFDSSINTIIESLYGLISSSYTSFTDSSGAVEEMVVGNSSSSKSTSSSNSNTNNNLIESTIDIREKMKICRSSSLSTTQKIAISKWISRSTDKYLKVSAKVFINFVESHISTVLGAAETGGVANSNSHKVLAFSKDFVDQNSFIADISRRICNFLLDNNRTLEILSFVSPLMHFIKKIVETKLYGSISFRDESSSDMNADDSNSSENILLISCMQIISTFNRRLVDSVYDADLILSLLKLINVANSIATSEVLTALEAIRSRIESGRDSVDLIKVTTEEELSVGRNSVNSKKRLACFHWITTVSPNSFLYLDSVLHFCDDPYEPLRELSAVRFDEFIEYCKLSVEYTMEVKSSLLVALFDVVHQFNDFAILATLSAPKLCMIGKICKIINAIINDNNKYFSFDINGDFYFFKNITSDDQVFMDRLMGSDSSALLRHLIVIFRYLNTISTEFDASKKYVLNLISTVVIISRNISLFANEDDIKGLLIEFMCKHTNVPGNFATRKSICNFLKALFLFCDANELSKVYRTFKLFHANATSSDDIAISLSLLRSMTESLFIREINSLNQSHSSSGGSGSSGAICTDEGGSSIFKLEFNESLQPELTSVVNILLEDYFKFHELYAQNQSSLASSTATSRSSSSSLSSSASLPNPFSIQLSHCLRSLCGVFNETLTGSATLAAVMNAEILQRMNTNFESYVDSANILVLSPVLLVSSVKSSYSDLDREKLVVMLERIVNVAFFKKVSKVEKDKEILVENIFEFSEALITCCRQINNLEKLVSVMTSITLEGSESEKLLVSVLNLTLCKTLSTQISLLGKNNKLAKKAEAEASDIDISCEPLISKKFIFDLADIALILLLEKDAVIRECCMMTLCLNFLSCGELSIFEVKFNSKISFSCLKSLVSGHCSLHGTSTSNSSTVPVMRFILLVDQYVTDVFATLVKEKRPDALIGFDAGVSNASRPGGNSATQNTSGANSGASGTATPGTSGVGNAASVANSTLLSAVGQQMAQELGLDLSQISNEITGRQSAASRTVEVQDYGALKIICKIVKRGGDYQLFFSLLYLLLDGSIFANKKLVKRYCPFPVRLQTDRIKKLLPMLFMCKFDPTLKIRELMRKLWDTVVAPNFDAQVQGSVTVQNDIIRYLISCLGNSNWRERESSCSALDNYLVLRSWNIIFPFMGDLWYLGLRSIDDLRESNRLAALAYMKTLSKQMLRACDSNENKVSNIQANLEVIMPLVLDKGVTSASCAEAKAFSFGLLIEIITKVISNKNQRLLDKWLVDIIGIMTDSMSALEPQTLQYLQLHQSRLQITGNELENIRIQLANNSPMQQILQTCLQNISGNLIPEAAFKLCIFLQRGIGFPSRYSAAQSICTLVDLYPAELKKSGGSKSFSLILDTLLSVQGQFMNQTMYRSFVSAVGSLAKIIEVSDIVDNCKSLMDSYLNISRDDDNRSVIIATCLSAIVQKSSERLNDFDLFRRLASTAYIGSFDSDSGEQGCQAIWTQIWSELQVLPHVGLKGIAVNKFLFTILQNCHRLLNDLSWKKRSQSLTVIKDVVLSLNHQQFAPNMGAVLKKLFLMIPSGHSWSGFHLVFDAISDILCKCTNRLMQFTGADEKKSSDVVFFTSDSSNNCLEILNLSDLSMSNLSTAAAAEENSSTAIAFISASSAADGGSSLLNKSDDFFENPSEISEWRVNPGPVIRMFLSECKTRTDPDFKIFCSRYIRKLPWKYMIENNLLEVSSLLGTLCDIALLDFSDLSTKEMDRKRKLEELSKATSSASGTTASSSSSAFAASSTSPSSSGGFAAASTKSVTSVPAAKPASKPNVLKQTNPGSLFGNRYGAIPANPKATAGAKVSATSTGMSRTTTTTTTSVTTTTTTLPPPAGGGGAQRSSSSAASLMSLPSAPKTNSSTGPVYSSASSGGGIDNSSDKMSISNSSNVDISSALSVSSSSTSSSTLESKSIDPALKSKLIDCIESIFSAISETKQPSMIDEKLQLSPQLFHFHSNLTLWVSLVGESESITVRASGLSLFAKLLLFPINELHLPLIFDTILHGVRERKVSRVQMAALDCLESAISGCNRAMLIPRIATIQSELAMLGDSSDPKVLTKLEIIRRKL